VRKSATYFSLLEEIEEGDISSQPYNRVHSIKVKVSWAYLPKQRNITPPLLEKYYSELNCHILYYEICMCSIHNQFFLSIELRSGKQHI